MADNVNIDNVRYAMEQQEYFQRQIEEAANNVIKAIGV